MAITVNIKGTTLLRNDDYILRGIFWPKNNNVLGIYKSDFELKMYT